MDAHDHHSVRQQAAWFMVAGAATAVAGAVLLFGLQPSTDLSDDMWRYPWESSGAFSAFSLFSAALHVVVAVGIVAFGRSGVAGRSRAATGGVALAVAGTSLLLVGELASIPIRNAETSDTSAGIVGGVFGLGGILSAVGFLLLGWATVRARVWHDWRRFTPLATGLSLIVMAVVTAPFPTALHGMVGVYGLCLLGMAAALYTAPTPKTAMSASEQHLQR
ncbi:MAG: hypothetical protein AB7W59_32265 [Acidimicrobiia bacterium]